MIGSGYPAADPVSERSDLDQGHYEEGQEDEKMKGGQISGREGGSYAKGCAHL